MTTVNGRPITDYEKLVLRHIAGEPVEEKMWGTGFSIAINNLANSGLLRARVEELGMVHELTDAGRKAIAS